MIFHVLSQDENAERNKNKMEENSGKWWKINIPNKKKNKKK